MSEARIKQLEKQLEILSTRDHLIGSGARVYNSANISIPNAAWTALTFNSERFDIGGYHSTSSNTDRLTVPYDGVYLITGHIDWTSNATGLRAVGIYANSTFVAVDQRPASSTGTRFSITTIYKMSATSYVTLNVYQSSGSDLNLLRGINYSPEFSIWRIG